MAGESKIEWCDATFNPWWGCERVSPGCARCYAADWARFRGKVKNLWSRLRGQHAFQFPADAYWRTPLLWSDRARRGLLPNGTPNPDGHRPRVFCASMADVFEERDELDEHRIRLFELIEETPELDWLILTKRPEFARTWLPDYWSVLRYDPLPNVWLGVSIENARYTWRADVLREIPAAVRFISAEPLLGSLYDWRSDDGTRLVDRGEGLGRLAAADVRGRDGRGIAERGELPGRSVDALAASGGTRSGDSDADGGCLRRDSARVGRAPLDLSGIDWVIIGGESGPKARPFHLEHAREIIDAALAQCGACERVMGRDGVARACEHGDSRPLGICDRATAVFVKQLGAKPISGEIHGNHATTFSVPLRDRKGGDMDEWPADLRIREFPRSAVSA